MPTYKIRLASGEVQTVEGRKFAAYIQNVREWFFVHKDIAQYVLSHLDSGMRVRTIEHTTLTACRGDEVDAAKLTLKNLCEKVGEARVRSVLAGAPQLNNQELTK
jgi:hypothetical protein